MSRYALIGTAEDPTSIANVLNIRRRQLGLSLSELNDIAGLAGGYANKIFAPNYKKQLGHLSLPVFLQALGCKLCLVADDESLPLITRRAINEKHLSAAKVESISRHKRIS